MAGAAVSESANFIADLRASRSTLGQVSGTASSVSGQERVGRVALHFESAHCQRLMEKEIIVPEVVTGPWPTVVLVHGGLVDGSGWEDVYKIPKKEGYTVSIIQSPTSSLAETWRPQSAPTQGRKRPSFWSVTRMAGWSSRGRQRLKSRRACLYRGLCSG